VTRRDATARQYAPFSPHRVGGAFARHPVGPASARLVAETPRAGTGDVDAGGFVTTVGGRCEGNLTAAQSFAEPCTVAPNELGPLVREPGAALLLTL